MLALIALLVFQHFAAATPTARTGGRGEIDAGMIVMWFGTGEPVEYARVRFPDPFRLVECASRVRRLAA